MSPDRRDRYGCCGGGGGGSCCGGSDCLSLHGGGPRFTSLGLVTAPVVAPAAPPISPPTTTPTGPPIMPTAAPVAAPVAAPPCARSGSSEPHAASSRRPASAPMVSSVRIEKVPLASDNSTA